MWGIVYQNWFLKEGYLGGPLEALFRLSMVPGVCWRASLLIKEWTALGKAWETRHPIAWSWSLLHLLLPPSKADTLYFWRSGNCDVAGPRWIGDVGTRRKRGAVFRFARARAAWILSSVV